MSDMDDSDPIYDAIDRLSDDWGHFMEYFAEWMGENADLPQTEWLLDVINTIHREVSGAMTAYLCRDASPL